jgi:hypothetical protein
VRWKCEKERERVWMKEEADEFGSFKLRNSKVREKERKRKRKRKKERKKERKEERKKEQKGKRGRETVKESDEILLSFFTAERDYLSTVCTYIK